MHLGVVRDRLLWAISLASKTATNRSNLPILSNILLTASTENYLQVESSNLELSTRLRIPAKIAEAGQTTVPARKFTDFLSSLSSETLDLVIDKKQFVVKSKESEARFVTMPANEFPELPTFAGTQAPVLIKVSEFRTMVKQVAFAAATSDTHPVLTGVLFDWTDGKELVSVATDSFRLSYTAISAQVSEGSQAIVPVSALTEVDRLLTDAQVVSMEPEFVSMRVSEGENQVFFQVGDVEVISRLLESNFPDYQRILPKEFNLTVRFNRIDLLNSIRSTAIFAAREGQVVKLTFDPSQGTLKSTARSTEVGAFEGSVLGDFEGSSESVIELGFNAKFLLDGIAAFNSNQIIMQIVNPTAPVLFSAEIDAGQFKHVVMPMSLGNGS